MRSIKSIITAGLFCFIIIGSDALLAQAPKEYPAPIARRVYGLETAGIDGVPIIFLYGDSFWAKKPGEDTYSVGQQLTLLGIVEYDFGTKLNYIDVVRIDPEALSADTYVKAFFKKEPPVKPSAAYYEVTGVIGKISSEDHIYLDDSPDLQGIAIDRDRIIDACVSSIKENLNALISEPARNRKLRNWMQTKYGISHISEDYILGALDNKDRIKIDYDFYDQMAKCTFSGKTIDVQQKSGVEIRLGCIYNSGSDRVDKIFVEFARIAKGSLVQPSPVHALEKK